METIADSLWLRYLDVRALSSSDGNHDKKPMDQVTHIVFWEKLLKHPTSKDDMGYLSRCLLATVSIGYRLWSIGAAVV